MCLLVLRLMKQYDLASLPGLGGYGSKGASLHAIVMILVRLIILAELNLTVCVEVQSTV